MKIIVNGICGHMGKEVAKALSEGERGASLLGGIDIAAAADAPVPCAANARDALYMFRDSGADCIIDFSHHSCTADILSLARSMNVAVVIATTGHTEEETALIKSASEHIPVFFSANMSLGIALLARLARIAAKTMQGAEIEIIEKHHSRKLDAPSGTALMLANEIKTVREDAYNVNGRSGHGKRTKEEIGIHAVRMGNIVGEHEIIIGNGTETLTLKHEAHDRALFAKGAIAAAEFVYTRPAGLYGMHDIVSE